MNPELKIKDAARIVFHKKGYAATRTRDIAEESGINLALINYYFRSKEKLFNLIMLETMQAFLQSVSEVFNNESTTLEFKIETLAIRYIDLLTENPDIPLFLLSESRSRPDDLVSKIGMKKIVMKSHFIKQFQQGVMEGKIAGIHPFHYLMNLMSLIVFPFAARPIIRGLGDLSQKEFEKLMQERKSLIPVWMNAILKTG